MKLYRTSKNVIINLDNISVIEISDEITPNVLFSDGEWRNITINKEDLENIMEYNNYLIK